MNSRFFFSIASRAALLFLLLTALAPSPAAAADAATAIAVTPEVLVERGGKRFPLEVKGGLEASDLLISNAGGKAQIIFTDDTTVSLAPNTTLSLGDFAFDDTKQSISLNLVSGISRIATGEIAKRNPKGFRVETPQASIGIRGTMFSVSAGAEQTSIVLFETSGSGIDVINKSTGQLNNLGEPGRAIDVSAVGSTERQATPEEMRSISQGTRDAGTQQATQQAGQELTPVTSLASSTAPLGGQGSQGAAEDSPLILYEDPTPMAAAPPVSAGLDLSLIRGSYGANYASGVSPQYNMVDVRFNVDGNANISDAAIMLTHTGGTYAEVNQGSGTIGSNGSFLVNNFLGATGPNPGYRDDGSSMNGVFDSPTGGKLNWDIMLNNTGSGLSVQESGSNIPFVQTETAP